MFQPFDEDYLSKKDIKHMSFHAYLCKFKSHGKSTHSKCFLDNVYCRIKPGCTTHPPWPDGICTKCQPNAVTLNRQVKYLFENTFPRRKKTLF